MIDLGIIKRTANYINYHFFHKKLSSLGGTGGTDKARYCYSIWLRHLITAQKNGFPSVYKNIVELGPGDSLGIGLAALLSGSDRYYALDVIKFAQTQRNLQIFSELVTLYKTHSDIPDSTEYPEIRPLLDNYSYPEKVLPKNDIQKNLNESKIEKIQHALQQLDSPKKTDTCIDYIVPWNSPHIIEKESVDLIFSQAVLEHVENLDEIYQYMYSWLRPGGIISHQIDFRSHGMTPLWNGHWGESESGWKEKMSRQAYTINRHPLSDHLLFLKKAGFKNVKIIPNFNYTGLKKTELSGQFSRVTDEDLVIESALIQANK
jgi:hypothetical protein